MDMINKNTDDNTKIIILVEGNINEIGMIMDAIKKNNKNIVYENSNNLENKYSEYDYLIRKINDFCNTEYKNVLVVRYSGKEYIAKELGDECSQIIISISFRKRSIYYTNKPKDIVLELIELFNKENYVRD